MTRSKKIQKKIKKLEAQLDYWKSELKRAQVSDAENAQIFQKVPARVRNLFDDYDELIRFLYGQHDGISVCGCSPYSYKQANTPCERLEVIKGIGHQTAVEALKILELDYRNENCS